MSSWRYYLRFNAVLLDALCVLLKTLHGESVKQMKDVSADDPFLLNSAVVSQIDRKSILRKACCNGTLQPRYLNAHLISADELASYIYANSKHLPMCQLGDALSTHTDILKSFTSRFESRGMHLVDSVEDLFCRMPLSGSDLQIDYTSAAFAAQYCSQHCDSAQLKDPDTVYCFTFSFLYLFYSLKQGRPVSLNEWQKLIRHHSELEVPSLNSFVIDSYYRIKQRDTVGCHGGDFPIPCLQRAVVRLLASSSSIDATSWNEPIDAMTQRVLVRFLFSSIWQPLLAGLSQVGQRSLSAGAKITRALHEGLQIAFLQQMHEVHAAYLGAVVTMQRK